MYIIVFGPYINKNCWGTCISHNSGSEPLPAPFPGLNLSIISKIQYPLFCSFNEFLHANSKIIRYCRNLYIKSYIFKAKIAFLITRTKFFIKLHKLKLVQLKISEGDFRRIFFWVDRFSFCEVLSKAKYRISYVKIDIVGQLLKIFELAGVTFSVGKRKVSWFLANYLSIFQKAIKIW